MSAMLSAAELRRLVGVLARLESTFDGERAAAALLASRMLRDKGLTWPDVLQVESPTRAAGAADPPRYADPGSDFGLCMRHIQRLTPWERGFFQSVARVVRRTPGQSRKLQEIADWLRKNGAE